MHSISFASINMYFHKHHQWYVRTHVVLHISFKWDITFFNTSCVIQVVQCISVLDPPAEYIYIAWTYDRANCWPVRSLDRNAVSTFQASCVYLNSCNIFEWIILARKSRMIYFEYVADILFRWVLMKMRHHLLRLLRAPELYKLFSTFH